MPWYYQHGEGEIVGPVSLETLRELAGQREIDGNTQVSFAEGEDQPATWQLAHSVSSLELQRESAAKTPRPPQPSSQRLSINDPLRQAAAPKRQISALPAVSLVTLLSLVLGIMVFAAGVIGHALTAMEALSRARMGRWVEDFLPQLLMVGVGFMLVSLLYELIRVNRATLLFMQRQHRDAHVQFSLLAGQGDPTQSPTPEEKHPLD